MVAPSTPATIPKGARHSRSRCAAAGWPTASRRRRVPHERVQQILVARVLAGCLVLCGRSVEAQGPSGQAHPHVQQILLLQGVDRGSVTVDSFTANFRVDLDERVGRPVNVVQVVVGPTGFVGAPEQAVVDYIRSTFANRSKPDLIVTALVLRRPSRASIDSSSFPTRRSCSRLSTSDILRDAPLGRTRPPSRSTTIFRDSSTTSCSCFPGRSRCSW